MRTVINVPVVWGGEESTSGLTTSGEALHYLFDIPFVRKVDHGPLRDVTRLEVFLFPHIPLAAVL